MNEAETRKGFLEFVLAKLLTLKYKALEDAGKELGDAQKIRSIFINF